MEKERKHIMAIGAHIGDMELTAGLTMAKHAGMGDMITTVSLTAGERGAPDTIAMNEFKKMNIDSAKAFADTLGGQSIVLNYRDGEVPSNDEIKFQVCDLIRTYKPDILITHWKNSIHKDHINTHKIVIDAHYYAAIPNIEREEPAHFAKGPYYADNWEDSQDFNPYIFVDVEDAFKLWEKAVKKLWLTENSPWFKYFDYYKALSVTRGAIVQKARAEVFAVNPEEMRLVVDSF